MGILHGQLGIPAEARIMLQMVTDGPMGAYIWDLESGKTYIVVQGGSHNPILPGQRDVPQHVQDVIAATDDELKQRWLSTMGWDEVRETVFSELVFRGIDILKLEGMG